MATKSKKSKKSVKVVASKAKAQKVVDVRKKPERKPEPMQVLRNATANKIADSILKANMQQEVRQIAKRNDLPVKGNDPGPLPAFLDRSKMAKAVAKPVPPRHAELKARIAATRPQEPQKPAAESAVSRFMAKLKGEQAKASAAAPKAGNGVLAKALAERDAREGKAIPRQTPGAPHSGSKLTVTQVKVGMRVRVMGLDKADVLSKGVYMIQPYDKDEPTPGPEWFAIDDVRCVHVGDLRVA